MEHGHIPTIAAAVPRDYIFTIDYHAFGSTVHIVKGMRHEADAWRRLKADYDLRGVRSITWKPSQSKCLTGWRRASSTA
ncbi:hypothetical protein [Caballeronia catudaia]|uniref:hypothetical protein n=1 Tax=Caballeronia catudaia TaxID=1777136 RepID=UPI00117FE113|nr:hypothetical protein [Caballeronia catudaia]